MTDIKADAFVCAWYHGGLRDFHLAFMKENARPGAISVLRVADGRTRDDVVAENRRFGASEVHVFRTRGRLMRVLEKCLPIFALYVFLVARRAGARELFVTHDGFCFWAIPSALLSRRAWVFAHDPAPHESAESPLAAWVRRRYFRFVYYRKRWRAVVVGSERNREVLQEGGCASPTAVRPFPVFGSDLFELAPPEETPELGELEGYVLFFGRVDVYKGVHDWLAEQSGEIDRPVVIAGRVIDERVLSFRGRATFIDRFIRNGEVAGLFGRAAALVCPYLSATHSGVVDLGLSYGLPVYVSRIPYFTERYEGVEGVRWIDRLPDDLAAQDRALRAGERPA